MSETKTIKNEKKNDQLKTGRFFFFPKTSDVYHYKHYSMVFGVRRGGGTGKEYIPSGISYYHWRYT